MKKNLLLKSALATATMTLIAGAAHAEEEKDKTTPVSKEQAIGDWKFDAAFLFYSESDSRVSAIEPVFNANKRLDEDEYLNLKLTVDSLTGASPSGAVASDQPLTFTRPSGNDSYTVNANEYPLDDTFKDTRAALAANWTFPVSDMTKAGLGANISKEYDYLSASINGNISYDFNNRNSTLFAGLSYAFDSIDPVGGAPIAFGRMQPVGDPQNKLSDTQDKDTLDLLLGITQVIDRESLFQFNYSYSMSDGYHNDPYKVLSVLDDQGNYFDDGIPVANVLFESRPDERTKHGLFGRYKRYVGGDILDVSYRYMTDDWEIDSHTVDFKYRFALDNGDYWQPHVRYYTQTQADFYQPYLRQDQPLPQFASSDYRLAEYDAITVGLEYGMKTAAGNQWRFSLEMYNQTPTEPEKYGALQQQTLLPDWNAVMLRVNYSF